MDFITDFLLKYIQLPYIEYVIASFVGFCIVLLIRKELHLDR